MIDYHRILEGLRQGRSNREIATEGLASRNTLKGINAAVAPLGWLDPSNPLPSVEEIEWVLVRVPDLPRNMSKVEPFAELVREWHDAGHAPKQIHGALARQKRFGGSLGAVKRYLRRLAKPEKKALVALQFEAGDSDRHSLNTTAGWPTGGQLPKGHDVPSVLTRHPP